MYNFSGAAEVNCSCLQNSVYNGACVFSFALPSFARMAELADAVDSKSTDESLVGSTPTLGTMKGGVLGLSGGRGDGKSGLNLHVPLGVNVFMGILFSFQHDD